MSYSRDLLDMHAKYGVHESVDALDSDKLNRFMELRIAQIEEELNELKDAVANNDPEEIVDALVDISVFAIGTMDLFQVDGHRAWNQVLEANLDKEVGIKPGRPNPFGLPDLIKPAGWEAPSHEGNHGRFVELG